MQRLAKVQDKLADSIVLVLSEPSTIEYLVGFHTLVPNEREALLLVARDRAVLLHAYFSPLPKDIDKISGLQTRPGCQPANLGVEVGKFLENQIKTVMVDKSNLFVSEFEAVQEAIKKVGGNNKGRNGSESNDDRNGGWGNSHKVNLLPLDDKLVWEQRMVKDEDELEKIRIASQISIDAFQKIVGDIEVGVSELEVAQALEAQIRAMGADLSFPTIVAFGEHTALPHYQPTSETKLYSNTPILIDWGAKYHGYCADMTRSWWFGSDAPLEYQRVAEIVLLAYHETINKIKSNLDAEQDTTASDIDSSARSVIDKAGFGSNFIHTTGHGLGLDIHESPSLSSRNQTKITNNMAFTIEPGIYIEGEFGFRYERTVIIKDGGVEELANEES